MCVNKAKVISYLSLNPSVCLNPLKSLFTLMYGDLPQHPLEEKNYHVLELLMITVSILGFLLFIIIMKSFMFFILSKVLLSAPLIEKSWICKLNGVVSIKNSTPYLLALGFSIKYHALTHINKIGELIGNTDTLSK
jgi:hypothetical protein